MLYYHAVKANAMSHDCQAAVCASVPCCHLGHLAYAANATHIARATTTGYITTTPTPALGWGALQGLNSTTAWCAASKRPVASCLATCIRCCLITAGAVVNAETDPDTAYPGRPGIVCQHFCGQYAVVEGAAKGDPKHGAPDNVLNRLAVVKGM